MSIETCLLDGKWELKCLDSQKNMEDDRTLAIDVPGDVHHSLFNASVVPDPFHGVNFKACDWVSRCDWLIYRDFTVDSSLQGKTLQLVFDGIDTYSSIRLNGHWLGETNNMFLQYCFDINDIVKFDAPNHLEIEIHSTRNTIEKRDVSGYFACFNVHRIFSRRIQCQFSWDWAPDLPSVGIWQSVKLQALTPGSIEDVYARGDCDGNASFDIEIDLLTGDAEKPSLSNVSIDIEFSNHRQTLRKSISATGRKNFVDMKIETPDLWWPNGYGEANLYDYEVVLKDGDTILDRHSGRFGFRTATLIQEPLPDDKRSFRFEINGKPIFCMGANWVPCDCFTGGIKDETYRRLLTLAKDANLNSLRVWGGGMYENDIFYTLCDEMGILVWQDMMFACGDIPDDDSEFVKEVVKEFKYQVKRLRPHPCIFHWCGGNEKTGAFGQLVTRGDLITKFLARGIIKDYIPQATYTPSSPFSYNDIANNSNSGDSHGGTYEEAFADDITKFRSYIDQKKSVFMSEFGLYGPPVIRSLKKFMPQESLWPLNDIWEAHVQDNPYNSIPETFVQIQAASAERLFFKPESIGDFVKTAGTFYAEYLYAEFQHHRRRLPENNGAMIWMFNDCWPAANWSVVDYYGQPKQAYYALKRACQPVMLSFREADKKIEAYLTNNSLSAVDGKVSLYLQNVEGSFNQLIAESQVSVTSHNSRVVLEIDRDNRELYTENCYILAVFKNELAAVQEVYFHNLWKDIAWPEPDVKMQILSNNCNDNQCRVICRLTASKFARCVNLATREDIDVLVSDNYFDIPAGQHRDIVITSCKEFEAEKLILNHWLTDWEDEKPFCQKHGLKTVS